MTCNSCINSFSEYGTRNILKERPNLVTFLIFIEPSELLEN